ncbi:MAG: helix-turn-helix domain-containing protein [Nocardioidaceae bacterium]|nr:helix-turn-helix domain-containing protein [Nocardioidaceae bacterium]
MARTSDARPAAATSRRALDRLLSADEVAEFLGIPVATLYQWRHKGTGPDAYRIGRHLRYEPRAVRAWLDEHLADHHGAH